MNVFVLEAQIAYEGGTVLGVYSSRSAAVDAAHMFEWNNRAAQHPTDYDYYIYEVGVDVVGRDRRFVGELLEVE